VFVNVFDELYYEALVGPWAWEPVDDVLPVRSPERSCLPCHASPVPTVGGVGRQVLDRLLEWRREGGPKIGVISDFDERLTTILENLDMAHYFDFIISSRWVPALRPVPTRVEVSWWLSLSGHGRGHGSEAGVRKPERGIFELALERAGVSDPSKALHLGKDFDGDVVGAARAGFQSYWVVCPSYDTLEPEQAALQVSYLLQVGGLGPVVSNMIGGCSCRGARWTTRRWATWIFCWTCTAKATSTAWSPRHGRTGTAPPTCASSSEVKREGGKRMQDCCGEWTLEQQNPFWCA
jgi:phosphoglycolate phosphatase-like HAD superfamily hydrolase